MNMINPNRDATELTRVTVDGRLYLVQPIRRAGAPGAETVKHDYVNYWVTLGGEPFGPARYASCRTRPGKLGRAVFEAAEAAEAAAGRG